MKSTSVSQIESFDHAQKGGCQRKWWFETVKGLKPEQDTAQGEGEAGHALLAAYLTDGTMPGKRVKMGKAVTGAILKGGLPTPGADLLIETRFDGQPRLDVNGQWLPLMPDRTLWLAGVPLDGFIDVRFRRGEIPDVGDHKFSVDIEAYAKRGVELIKTVQMPVYVLDSLRRWPDAEEWRIWHHYVSRKGVASFIRSAIVHVDDVLERKRHIEATIEEMKIVEVAANQEDVPFNRRSCGAWSGCSMQTHCRAFKENQMQMSPEDLALFEGLDAPPAAGVDPKAAAIAAKRAELAALESPPPPTEAEIKAAKLAKMKAELAALEGAPAAAAVTASGRPRVTIQDVEPEAAPIPDSAPAPKPVVLGKCPGCKVALTIENMSTLRDGRQIHVGCPTPAVATVPPDAPKSDPAKASEQPAPTEAPKVRKPPKPPAPPPAEPSARLEVERAAVGLAPTTPGAHEVTITLRFASAAAAAAYLAR